MLTMCSAHCISVLSILAEDQLRSTIFNSLTNLIHLSAFKSYIYSVVLTFLDTIF